MPHKSLREIRKELKRLHRTDRYVDALLVVEDHTGAEVLRVGGCWDRLAHRYVDRPCKERRVRLEESQQQIGRALARWLDSAKKNEKRIRALIAGGNRGSGKTYFLGGIAIVVMMLAFPGHWMYGVNLTAKQKRECLEAIRAVAAPEWIIGDVTDFRDPRTLFVTGATVSWLSAQNPRAIRSAGLPICYVLINEGQDMPEVVANNSIAAIRNVGGLIGVATNPPQTERSDWVASWWTGIEADELNGEKYFLDNKLNRTIDQDALPDIAAFLYATNREAGDADAAGIFKLSGPVAYENFKALPAGEKGGHVGDPPQVGWKDVTREISAAAIEGTVGFDFVVGVDWNKTPGVAAQLAKLYRTEAGVLVLHVLYSLNVRGVEADFSQALYAAGFATTPGVPDKPSVLLIGDATGARQNTKHDWSLPESYKVMQADGWKVIPPDRHWKHRTPWNPTVRDSRAQMYLLFEKHQVLLSPKCKEPSEGFPSLVESFRKAKVGPKGGLIPKGDFQHGPDGVRYLAWKFLPRPKPAPVRSDPSVASQFLGIRLTRT